MTTPREEVERAAVPEHEAPRLGDEFRHVNGLYTPTGGERALPTDVVVISDTNSMYNEAENSNIFDLYEVGDLKGEEASPFVHGVELAGPKGEIVRFRSVFDDGASVNAIDETLYHTLKSRLTALTPSKRILRVADGRRVPSAGVWRGEVTVGGVSREGAFEIFKSNGAWAMLFGKPLLQTFNAVHDYSEDVIRIPQVKTEGTEWVVLGNQFSNVQGVAEKLLVNRTADIKQLITIPQNEPPPANKTEKQKCNSKAYKLHGGFTNPLEGSTINTSCDAIKPCVTNNVNSSKDPILDHTPHISEEDQSPIWILDDAAGKDTSHPGAEQPVTTKIFEPTVLTRKTDPNNPERVKAILSEITIGQDLTPEQRTQVEDLISEYAVCFALSMSEVSPVEGAAHRLDIPRDKQFRTKVNQRPQSPPQKEFFNEVIDKMLTAGIIRPIDHQDVKCCGATTLAKKAHEGGGSTLDSLKHRVNDECITAGFPSAFEDLPPVEEGDGNPAPQPTQNKWQVCQDFAELNNVTKVPPMPQGDIRRKGLVVTTFMIKTRRLPAGHRV